MESLIVKLHSMFLLGMSTYLPSLAFAESLTAPAYLTFGSGLLVVLGLATYVVKRLRDLTRRYAKKPVD